MDLCATFEPRVHRMRMLLERTFALGSLSKCGLQCGRREEMSSVRQATCRMILLVSVPLMLAGCSGGLDGLRPIPAALEGPTRVDTGDSVKVVIDDIDGTDGVYVVSSAGTISLPYIQELQVRGLTIPEVQTKIAATYKSAGILNKPEVNVQPAELRPFYVLGEVGRPGEFEYRQGMTVQAAISAAGGYTYRAKTDQVEITRTINGREVIGTGSSQTPITPGDRIRVFERWF